MINFGSDNEAPIRDEILDAMLRANQDFMMSYGEDSISRSLNSRFSLLFEKEVEVFPVITGTAANCISLAQLSPSYGGIFCHENSHLNLHETGAPEFFSGAKAVGIAGPNGKISPKILDQKLRFLSDHKYHSSQPAVLSLTQATEYGTVYSPEEIAELSNIAKKNGVAVHMDGARFANAVAYLQCSPADITWKSGVDMLSFGSTKNGTLNAEAIVSFSKEHTQGIKWRLKQSGQLTSKMRYLSAQLTAYVAKDHWLSWANEVNQLALLLDQELRKVTSIEVMFDVQANFLIVRMEEAVANFLHNHGVNFYPWREVDHCYRLVLSNINTKKDIGAFIEILSRWKNEAALT